MIISDPEEIDRWIAIRHLGDVPVYAIKWESDELPAWTENVWMEIGVARTHNEARSLAAEHFQTDPGSSVIHVFLVIFPDDQPRFYVQWTETYIPEVHPTGM